MAKVVKQISFNSKRDAKLLACIEQLPKGEFSKTVRVALLAHFEMGGGVTLGLLYQELQAIKRRLENGAVVMASPSAEGSSGVTLSDDLLNAFD